MSKPPSDGSASSVSSTAGLDEFSVINRFFTQTEQFPQSWPSQGVGDDCAFLDIGDSRIAVSTDMLALGTHFLEGTSPYYVGRKVLAVNLSDLAAAGAKPQAFFLSISLPQIDPEWLSEFSRGLLEQSHESGCPLRGGDTVRSPDGSNVTSFSVTILGEVPPQKGMTRAGAKEGDDVWVSGTPGDAFAALGSAWHIIEPKESDKEYFFARLQNPTPRVALGRALLDLASACADISDGLVGDLGHILERSGVSAVLLWSQMPRSDAMKNLPLSDQYHCVLSGGDDYELIFTAPPENRNKISALDGKFGCRVTRIGTVTSSAEPFAVMDDEGKHIPVALSFNHFA